VTDNKRPIHAACLDKADLKERGLVPVTSPLSNASVRHSGMTKTELFNVATLDGIITEGDCPLCGTTIFHDSIIGGVSRDQVPDMFAHHLKEKHPNQEGTSKKD
jgi:hypothetical protein